MVFGSGDHTDNSEKIDIVGKFCTFACPMIVVMISCLVCVVFMRQSVNCYNQAIPHVVIIKQKATLTIIIFTVVFLIFNIPEWLQTILWFITIQKYHGWPGPIYSSHPIMFFYLKNFTNILCLGINATANPLVLFWRMQRYQQWLKKETNQIVARGGKVATDINTAVQGEMRHLNTVAGLTSSQIISDVRRLSDIVREESVDGLHNLSKIVYSVKKVRHYVVGKSHEGEAGSSSSTTATAHDESDNVSIVS